MEEECHVATKSVKAPAEALGWSLTLGREGLSGLSNDEHPAPNAFSGGLSNYPPYPMAVPGVFLLSLTVYVQFIS